MMSPNDAYMRRQIVSYLVQLLVCRLFDTKILREPVPTYCHLSTDEHISIEFVWNSNSFINANVFENIVCKTGTILSRSPYHKPIIKTDKNAVKPTDRATIALTQNWQLWYKRFWV